jgi:hypothetical protein
MKNKTLTNDEKCYVKQLESHIPEIDPIYGLEGYVHDICLAADIRKGRPIICKTPNCYENVIPYRWNNPFGETDYERQLHPFGYFKCIKCEAIYPEMKEDLTGKAKNKAKGDKKFSDIIKACAAYNQLKNGKFI